MKMIHVYATKKLLRHYHLVCLIGMLLISSSGFGQVTIGDGVPPQPYSLLELSTVDFKGGLRLPQITTAERDAFNFVSGADVLAQGLTIYNTDTRCVEYWNNKKWVSLCLGTANITLKSPCGDYDLSNPPTNPADGTATNCEYTPIGNPPCTVPSGQAYQVYLTAGDAYAFLSVDPLTSAFTISFQPNNSSYSRNAIVRVVDNCSGEFQDFIFTQDGATCPGIADPILNATSLSLCEGGSAYAYIMNAVAGADYIWTYGGVVVHTGISYEIKRAGNYTVYSGLLGCGTPVTLTVNKSASTAPSPTTITATNSGILCGGGNVILSAATTGAVVWYHNGIPHSGTGNPLTVTGAASAGEWFAVVKDGNCTSSVSNTLILSDQTTGSTALAIPKMHIDGTDISSGGSFTLCQNSGVVLEVGNKGSYPAGVFFEWFVNGKSLGIDTNPTKFYTVPMGATSISISLQVSNQGVNCPSTAVAPTASISFTAPGNTNINNGDTKAYICGGKPALLVASNQGGVVYEWRYNNELIAGQTNANLTTTKQGKYTVRYQDANGCWSRFSPAITVENSSAISMAWSMEPGGTAGEVIYGTTESYSVVSAPLAEHYTWKALRADGVTEIPMYPSGNDGATAAITYPTLVSPAKEIITITVTAKNGCGQTAISKNVELGAGCKPVSAVNITPNGATLTVGDPINNKMTFVATSEGADFYEWRLNNTVVGSNQPTYTYNATVAGTYTLSVTAKGCGGIATATASIEVKPDLTSIPEEPVTGNYGLAGKICFDVNRTSSLSCGPTSGRTDDFATTKTFYYTFTNTTSYSDLTFVVDDNSGVLIKPHSVEDNVLAITFIPTINDFIEIYSKAEITITAIYKNNAGQYRKVIKKIVVQDCSCCGAYISATEWKVFKCHNLGADESLDPFTPVQGIHGNYYQWGRSAAVATATTPEGSIAGWNTSYAPNGAWNDAGKTANDPCPTGFRLPKKSEWDGVLAQTAKNPQSNKGSWANNATNYGSGKYFGEGLFLPAAGYRYYSNGQSYLRGSTGYYWSSTGSSSIFGYSMYFSSAGAAVTSGSRSLGISVRCVAE